MSPEDVRGYFVGHGLELSSVFKNELPPSPDAAVAIRQYSGRPGYLRLDTRLPVDDLPRYQILVRAKTDAAALAQATALYELCHAQFALIGSSLTHWLEALGRPIYLLRDDSKRVVYVFNIEAHARTL